MEKVIFVISAVITGIIILKLYFNRFRRKDIIKKPPKMPGGSYRLFYTDDRSGEKMEGVVYSKLLYSETYDIQGKPDFIFAKGKRMLPVEIKSGSIGEGERPHKGDLMQLAAYFAIIEEVYGVRPLTGRVVYKDYMFIVKNTKKLRKELAGILKDMRTMLKTGEEEPNANFATCKHCICRGTVCEYCG